MNNNKPPLDRFKFLVRVISLNSPLAIVVFITAVHVALLIVSYDVLESARLSLYERVGLPSPSIGLTRSYWLLLRGDIEGAFERNKLMVVVAPIIWSVYLHALYQLVKTKLGGDNKPPMVEKSRNL